jgi:molybdopterin-guanine dinucleotide biosynthesis protein A
MGMAGQARTGVSGVVLAGGQSRRMGRNKALMELEGRTLIDRVLDRLSRLCDELIVSANDVDPYAHLAARIVRDAIPGRGALSGIHAGLAAMRNETAVVVACDMPFLSLSLLRYMTVVAEDYDVVVPRLDRYYEPLHAVYSARCIGPIEHLVAEGPQRVVALYERVRTREITGDIVRLYGADRSFFNVNTPQDWTELQRLSART